MKPAKGVKPYWQMSTEELQETTADFDDEFVAEAAKPMSPQMRRRWERARAKASGKEKSSVETISVRLNRSLLYQCTALAKKKHVSRDALIARGLRAILLAEGE
jgi:hypothetical protein